MKVLLIINGPAYGSDETFNALRLAAALAKRQDTEPRIFLMGDAVTCATAGQKTPDGYYTLDLIPEAPRSSMDELAAWTVEADRVLTF